MVVSFGLDMLRADWAQSVVCIGTFDGLHRGHRKVLAVGVGLAEREGQPFILLTFDRHPAVTLRPESAPPQLSTLNQTFHDLEGTGVSVCVILPFDKDLAAMSAQTFFDEILIKKLRAGHVVMGHDFAFGKGRQGTKEWLSDRIPVTIVEAESVEGTRISSSAIRYALLAGDVQKALVLAGRPFRLEGVVVHGEKLGRTLGYPTANVAPCSMQIVPGDGVYVTSTRVGDQEYGSVTSVGIRPSVGGTQRTVETYLLDYPGGEFYGQAVEITFYEKIRNQETYSDLQGLTAAIAEDVRFARQTLTKVTVP